MAVVARAHQIVVSGVDTGWVTAIERQRESVTTGLRRPPWVEGADGVLRVEQQVEAAGQVDGHVGLPVGVVGDVETEPTVEGERSGHVGHDDLDGVQTWVHGTHGTR